MRYMSDIQVVGVPYKASPQAFTDLVGGRVQFYVADVTSSINSIKNGQVRALAVTTPGPLAKLPGVPPLSQTFPGLDLVSWGGILGPAKMQAPIVAKLGREINAVLAEPDVQERLAGIGFEVAPSKSPEEFANYVREQIGIWANLVKQARIEPQ
jgi:tripartite-type tricarboxylate transporter receptor subunit TctC